MASISDILLEQGRRAGDLRRQRANVWIPTIQQLSNLPGQVMQDRQAAQERQSVLQDRAATRALQTAQGENIAADNKRANAVLEAGKVTAEHQRQMREVLGTPEALGKDGLLDVNVLNRKAQEKGYTEIFPDVAKAAQELNEGIKKGLISDAQLAELRRPKVTQEDPTKDTYTDGVLTRPGTGPKSVMHEVVVKGPNGRPVKKLVTEAELQGGVEQYEKPTDAGTDVTTLTPQGLDMAALRYKVTGLMPALGMGDKTTRQKIINRSAELTPEDETRINAGGGNIAANAANFRADSGSLAAMQKQRDAITSFEKTASRNIDLFLSQAGKVVDTGSPMANALARSVSGKMLGSPDQAAYDAARQVAINEIAKITSNPNMSGVLSDSARKEVETFNPNSATLKQTVAVMRLLKQDMTNRTKALDETLAATRGRLNGASATPKVTRYDENGKVIP